MNGRVKALELDADATDAVLDYLSRAHEHPSHTAYLDAEFERGEEGGILAIWGVLEKSSAPTRPDEQGNRLDRVQRSKANALFLHKLAQIVDDRARRIAELAGLKLGNLAFGREAFIANPVASPNAFRMPIAPPPRGASTTTWAELVAFELAEIDIEERARHIIENRHFRGRPLLYDETANDWLRLRWQADHIEEEVRIQALTSPTRKRPRRKASAQPSVARRDDQVAERVRDLEDLARVEGLRYLGEDMRARAIVRRHLRGVADESLSSSRS